MKTIGLIGGMSWESTSIYYRHLNEMARDRFGGLSSAKIILSSVDFSEVVQLQKADKWPAAATLLANEGKKLVLAGSDMALICTNTMHIVADDVQKALRIPLINIMDCTGQALKKAACSRPLLLATRYTMEHGFYQAHMKRRFDITVMTPNYDDRRKVHDIIFEELCQGKVVSSSREKLKDIILHGQENGADSVILGCTEICLLLNPNELSLKGFDSTYIHAKSAFEYATQNIAKKCTA